MRALVDSFELREDGPPSQEEMSAGWRFLMRQIEVNQTLTVLYLIVEAGRWQHLKGDDGPVQQAIGKSRSTNIFMFLNSLHSPMQLILILASSQS